MSLHRTISWPSCVHDRHSILPAAVAACATYLTRQNGLPQHRLLNIEKRPEKSRDLSPPYFIQASSISNISRQLSDARPSSTNPGHNDSSVYEPDQPLFAGAEKEAVHDKKTKRAASGLRNIIRYQSAKPDELKYPSQRSTSRKNTTSCHGVIQQSELQDERSASRNWRITWRNLYNRLIEARESSHQKENEVLAAECEYANNFMSGLSMDKFRSKLLFLGPKGRSIALPSLLIGSLLHSPERVLFILSCPIGIWNDFRTRMQCLRYLHSAYEIQIRQSPELAEKFGEQIARCRSPQTWTDPSFSPQFLDTLLKWSTPEECELLIRDYAQCYPFAQHQTLPPIIMHYVRQGDVEKALEFFRKLPRKIMHSAAPETISLRNSLLMIDTVAKTESGTNFRILPELLDLGIQPDADLHNIMIERAIFSEMPNVAWDLYHYLKGEGLEVNAKTHLNLLQDSFRRYYTKGVNEIMTAIHESDSLGKDPYLIAYSMNIVRCVSFSSHKSNPVEAFGKVMALFDRLWSRDTLHRFGILHGISASTASVSKPMAPPASLAFTLWSYILVQRSERLGDVLWQRLIRLVEANDKIVLALLHHDIVYNAFVLLYARKLDTLNKALRVVQYMLEKELCLPSARTWSMLICAFLRHGQLKQAKTVMDMMMARGLKIESISEPHLPAQYSLADFETRIEVELDERQMPMGLQESLSLAEAVASSANVPAS